MLFYKAPRELGAIYDRRKSFYGKALVKETVREHCDIVTLQSYQTDVVAVIYDEVDEPEIVRLWCGYSATSMRHINEFLLQEGLEGMNKAEWEAMPTYSVNELDKMTR